MSEVDIEEIESDGEGEGDETETRAGYGAEEFDIDTSSAEESYSNDEGRVEGDPSPDDTDVEQGLSERDFDEMVAWLTARIEAMLEEVPELAEEYSHDELIASAANKDLRIEDLYTLINDDYDDDDDGYEGSGEEGEDF